MNFKTAVDGYVYHMHLNCIVHHIHMEENSKSKEYICGFARRENNTDNKKTFSYIQSVLKGTIKYSTVVSIAS